MATSPTFPDLETQTCPTSPLQRPHQSPHLPFVPIPSGLASPTPSAPTTTFPHTATSSSSPHTNLQSTTSRPTSARARTKKRRPSRLAIDPSLIPAGYRTPPPFTPDIEADGHIRTRPVGENMAYIKHHLQDQVAPARFHMPWRERVRHFTWTWFTMTMATGGIAHVLYNVPLRFHGLYTIGCIFFIFNLVLFVFNITMISMRFYLYPHTFKGSFLHPTESLFIPAVIISLGILLINISEYGITGNKTGPWLKETIIILFWVDCALAVIGSCGIFLIMWSTQTFTISQMTPIWIFPAYPLLIIGPLAAEITRLISGPRAIEIIIGGFVLQGIGFMVSMMVYAAFLYRLMTQKLPRESLRPGMFISVGPSGFTIGGVIGMADNLARVVPADFMGNGPLAGQVTVIMANWMGLWLWGLAMWFFIVSVFAHWSCVGHGRLNFAMTWYSFVFPNGALITATFSIAKALDNQAIRIVGCCATCLLILVWGFVFFMMIRAVVMKQILWPQKQEDRDEGGWTGLKVADPWAEKETETAVDPVRSQSAGSEETSVHFVDPLSAPPVVRVHEPEP